MIGKKFNMLTVLEETDKKASGNIVYKCQCECGKITEVNGSYLRSGKTKSCGCLIGITAKEIHSNHIIGQTFGKLTVIEETDKKSGSYIVYKCKCSCGSITEVSSHNLVSGHTQSCGCLKSKGELLIGQVLRELNIEFEQQKYFADLVGETTFLKFDFYLPQNNICIEYQGEQHYYPIAYFGGDKNFILQQKYDQLKEEYCKKHNIRLLKIPYYDFKQINKEYIQKIIQEE